MQIVAALFTDEIELRPVPGPSTRIDLTGVHFSAPAPSAPPVTVTPHLVVIVRNEPGGAPDGGLGGPFHLLDQPDGTAEQIARNVQSKHGVYMWAFKAALRDHARCAANGLLCRLE